MSSAAKMVADSTQSDLPEKTKKRKKTVIKKKVKKKKDGEKRSRKKSEEDYNESDLDLENEIKPIGAYVKDREALLDQLFHCVKDASLDRNLPDVLKELPLEDLKRRCLEELEVMSKKRIRRILAGDDPGSISSSGTEEDTSEEEEEQQVDDDLLEYDGFEAHLADSTSQYTQGLGDSDRELDDEVGSYVQDDASIEAPGSSHSYTPSDVEMIYTEDNEQSNDYNTNDDNNYEEDTNQQDMEDEEMYQPEDVDEGTVNTVPQPSVTLPPPSFANTIRVRRDSEEAEEGEVFDDDYVTENLDTNPDKTVGETTESVEETTPSVETVTTATDKTDGSDVTNEAQPEIIDDKENVKSIESVDKPVESDGAAPVEVVEKPSEETSQDEGSEEPNQDAEDKKDEEVEIGNDNIENVVSVEQEGKIDENEDTEGECVDTDNEETDGNNDGEKETDEGGGEKSKSASRIVLPPAETIAPVLTKNQMELLELEMRARAIKAMLKMAK